MTETELAGALLPYTVTDVAKSLGRRAPGVAALDADARRQFFKEVAKRYPSITRRIISQANDACAHRFDVLGSGPVELGENIDWSCDFKTGFRWPQGFYSDLVPVDLSNQADVKVPWELSRCHHFVTLGQAYWLTGEGHYAREFRNQLRSWIDTNPVMGSINWVNAMEPAIRIVNWLWACALFRDAQEFTESDRKRLLASALEHCRFIVDNLELLPGNPPGNHYICNLVGLLYLGILLPEFQEAGRWLDVGLSGLLGELDKQVHPDGVDYESSTGYHRLVTELFASAFLLCRQNGVTVPKSAWERLEKMVEFTLWYTRPDGHSPLLGDADDGRLHKLTPAEPDDHRHLLGMGGPLFERPDFSAAAGETSHEAAWWFGVDGANAFAPSATAASTSELESRAFPDGGFYVMRKDDRYLIADCGHPLEHSGHAHNDTLSFELAALGRSWIVDSGTYVYTASREWRNRFRSAQAHNTVIIDGLELNTIVPDELFDLAREALPIVHQWESTKAYDLLDAQHSGYERIATGIVHRRRIYFDKHDGYWRLEDSVTGGGIHRINAFLHFAAGLRLEHQTPSSHIVVGEGPAGLVVALESTSPTCKLSLREDWISTEYGRKSPGYVLELEMNEHLPVKWSWLLLPVVDRSVIKLPNRRSLPAS